MTDLSKGRILVTGGAGFIGSAVIWELNRRGVTNILVTDILGQSEKWKNLVPLKFVDYLEADDFLLSLKNSANGFSDLSAIFHLGACSSTTETDASYLIGNNYEYTKTLAEFAVSGKRRFVYASSAATYGSIAAGLPETVELSDLRPLNMYGYSKHMFDLYARQKGILPHITGIKYFNVFGPNEYHKGDMRSVVHKAFHQIRETGAVQLFKSYRPEFRDGEQRRDFLYVKDAVAATVFLAEHVDGGGLFNLGSGEPNTWLTLVRAIYDALGKEPRIEFIEMPPVIRDKYQYFTCAHIDKLRAAGFKQPLAPLHDAVYDYVARYLVPGRNLGDEPK
ncbi:MAG: ADP-glyceromanno-heptose 6-epimerase [Acidobacteriaceae bacterium]|nr:ADP-glyceromanno-heptose 6-epimerase [Acidobacteriaceae bacterium]MBV9498145.1 ADP-glyceromanno-heptose 6-epimerase [Acidobacteriaceae bacterium]